MTNRAAPAGPRAKLSVFYFHRVLSGPDPLMPYEPDQATFARILGWIGAQFRVLHPMQACERLHAGTLPSRPAVITFDDGYMDNRTLALPVLERHRMSAAFFVATGFLEGGAMFNDRVIEAFRNSTCDEVDLRGLEIGLTRITDAVSRAGAIERVLRAVKHLEPGERADRVAELERLLRVQQATRLMMDPESVRDLHRAGMVIGAHTRNHPILKVLGESEAREEIEGGRDDLARIIGGRPLLFAYPNGKRGMDYDEREVGLVRDAGFAYAFSTEPGCATANTLRYEIPRFTPWDRTALRFQLRALANLSQRDGRTTTSHQPEHAP